MKLTGKTCPSATLPTTNPKWIDYGSKPGLRGGRPAANRLNHGTARTEFYVGSLLENICLETFEMDFQYGRLTKLTQGRFQCRMVIMLGHHVMRPVI
jgi:hypothetical protein